MCLSLLEKGQKVIYVFIVLFTKYRRSYKRGFQIMILKNALPL